MQLPTTILKEELVLLSTHQVEVVLVGGDHDDSL